MLSYTLHKASDYGYFVTREGSRGEFCPVLCAGSFDDCIAFIKSRTWPADTFGPDATDA